MKTKKKKGRHDEQTALRLAEYDRFHEFLKQKREKHERVKNDGVAFWSGYHSGAISICVVLEEYVKDLKEIAKLEIGEENQ